MAAGMNPMDLKRGIDTAVSAVVDSIAKQSRPVAIVMKLLKLVQYQQMEKPILVSKFQMLCKKLEMKVSLLLKKTKAWKQKQMLSKVLI